jgi:hypothetical protein
MGGRPQNVDNEELYNALGVAKDASDADIRKAYRKLALQVQNAICMLRCIDVSVAVPSSRACV